MSRGTRCASVFSGVRDLLWEGGCFLPGSQVKFAASFVSPLPWYVAVCGYTHNGRVITRCCRSCPTYFEAMIVDGAVPFSTQCSRAAAMLCVGSVYESSPTCPNEFGPGPS